MYPACCYVSFLNFIIMFFIKSKPSWFTKVPTVRQFCSIIRVLNNPFIKLRDYKIQPARTRSIEVDSIYLTYTYTDLQGSTFTRTFVIERNGQITYSI